ncbi:NEL-type E3 ubiquitin ligase domain-containing protein [Pseudomonas sp. 65/3-MNA-CIBAN-0223]|uniref:NEL-type E3 ubiquitin ligase domain-containing protein n=1 Tax=Pseudomonas sp. 65/3-MNA-CIBAN-0223 TaxID=3140476 RepID=UPI003333C035
MDSTSAGSAVFKAPVPVNTPGHQQGNNSAPGGQGRLVHEMQASRTSPTDMSPVPSSQASTVRERVGAPALENPRAPLQAAVCCSCPDVLERLVLTYYPREHSAVKAREWREFAGEQGASRFADILLQFYNQPIFRSVAANLTPWLDKLVAEPQLRKEVFLLCVAERGGAEFVTFNRMHEASLWFDVNRGLYASDPARLKRDLRSQYLLQLLERVAGCFHPEATVDVYLSLVGRVSKCLGLTTYAGSLRVGATSRLTPGQIEGARLYVVEKESGTNGGFKNWLANLPEMQAALKQRFAERFDRAQELLHQAVLLPDQEALAVCLEQRLGVLKDDQNAIRTGRREVTETLIRNHYQPMINAFFRKA